MGSRVEDYSIISKYIERIQHKFVHTTYKTKITKNPFSDLPKQEKVEKRTRDPKKTIALIRKLKRFNLSQFDSIIEDIESVNLNESLNEIIAALTNVKLKLPHIKKVVKVCSELHKRYELFAGMFFKEWKKRFVFPLTENGDKLTMSLCFYAELLLAGVFSEQPANILFVKVFKFITKTDGSLLHASTVLTFCDNYGEEFFGLIPKHIRVLAERYQMIIPRVAYIEPARQKDLIVWLHDYNDALIKVFWNKYYEIQKLEEKNFKILQEKNKLNKQDQMKYNLLQKEYQTILAIVQQITNALDEDLPYVLEKEFGIENVETSDNNIPINEDWYMGDIKMKNFYRKLPDIVHFVNNHLNESNNQIKSESHDDNHKFERLQVANMNKNNKKRSKEAVKNSGKADVINFKMQKQQIETPLQINETAKLQPTYEDEMEIKSKEDIEINLKKTSTYNNNKQQKQENLKQTDQSDTENLIKFESTELLVKSAIDELHQTKEGQIKLELKKNVNIDKDDSLFKKPVRIDRNKKSKVKIYDEQQVKVKEKYDLEKQNAEFEDNACKTTNEQNETISKSTRGEQRQQQLKLLTKIISEIQDQDESVLKRDDQLKKNVTKKNKHKKNNTSKNNIEMNLNESLPGKKTKFDQQENLNPKQKQLLISEKQNYHLYNQKDLKSVDAKVEDTKSVTDKQQQKNKDEIKSKGKESDQDIKQENEKIKEDLKIDENKIEVKVKKLTTDESQQKNEGKIKLKVEKNGKNIKQNQSQSKEDVQIDVNESEINKKNESEQMKEDLNIDVNKMEVTDKKLATDESQQKNEGKIKQKVEKNGKNIKQNQSQSKEDVQIDVNENEINKKNESEQTKEDLKIDVNKIEVTDKKLATDESQQKNEGKIKLKVEKNGKNIKQNQSQSKEDVQIDVNESETNKKNESEQQENLNKELKQTISEKQGTKEQNETVLSDEQLKKSVQQNENGELQTKIYVTKKYKPKKNKKSLPAKTNESDQQNYLNPIPKQISEKRDSHVDDKNDLKSATDKLQQKNKVETNIKKNVKTTKKNQSELKNNSETDTSDEFEQQESFELKQNQTSLSLKQHLDNQDLKSAVSNDTYQKSPIDGNETDPKSSIEEPKPIIEVQIEFQPNGNINYIERNQLKLQEGLTFYEDKNLIIKSDETNEKLKFNSKLHESGLNQQDKGLANETNNNNKTTNKDKTSFDEFLFTLMRCREPKDIDEAAFNYYANFKKKEHHSKLMDCLYYIGNEQHQHIPLYCRFIAVLYPVLPRLGKDFSKWLRQAFIYHILNYSKTNYNENLKLVYYIGELVKFDIFPKLEAVYCIRLLLDNFNIRNIMLISHLMESCGRYLISNAVSQNRIANYVAELMRKKELILNQHFHDVINHIHNYLYPNPDAIPEQIQSEPSTYILIRKVLYTDLNKDNLKQVTKLIRKHYRDENADYIVTCFSDAFRMKSDRIKYLALVLERLNNEDLNMRVIDNIIDEIQFDIELYTPDIEEKNLAQIKYLGELFNCKLASRQILMNVLYNLISHGTKSAEGNISPVDPRNCNFRLQLVCVLLETCAPLMKASVNSKELNLYITFLQTYFLAKYTDTFWNANFPRHIRKHVVDSIGLFKPSAKFYLEERLDRIDRNEIALEEDEVNNDYMLMKLIEAKNELDNFDESCYKFRSSCKDNVKYSFTKNIPFASETVFPNNDAYPIKHNIESSVFINKNLKKSDLDIISATDQEYLKLSTAHTELSIAAKEKDRDSYSEPHELYIRVTPMHKLLAKPQTTESTEASSLDNEIKHRDIEIPDKEKSFLKEIVFENSFPQTQQNTEPIKSDNNLKKFQYEFMDEYPEKKILKREGLRFDDMVNTTENNFAFPSSQTSHPNFGRSGLSSDITHPGVSTGAIKKVILANNKEQDTKVTSELNYSTYTESTSAPEKVKLFNHEPDNTLYSAVSTGAIKKKNFSYNEQYNQVAPEFNYNLYTGAIQHDISNGAIKKKSIAKPAKLILKNMDKVTDNSNDRI